MKLLFDIGNSRAKYVLYDKEQMSKTHYIERDQLTHEWLTANFAQVSQCLIANVSQNTVVQIIHNWCQQQHISCQVIMTEANRFGVKCAYAEPSHFGVDRWLALHGAQQLFANKNCLILDAGTATTFDVLLANGEHKGGWILPGIRLLVDSLLSNTEQISAQVDEIDKLCFADNTSEAVNQAAWAATIASIKLAKQQIHQQFGLTEQQLAIVITGGNAKRIAQLYFDDCHVIEQLVFVGMLRYL